MGDKEKLTVNKRANSIVDVACMECHRSNEHTVLCSADMEGEDASGEIHWDESWQVVQCRGCRTTSFRRVATNSEDYHRIGPDEWEQAEHVDLYPSRNEGRVGLKDSRLLPTNVERIYEETIHAMNSEQPVLAGIGIRALVETICKDKNAVGNRLVEKIDSLVTLGVLTPEGAQILHKIRTLGNDAAHEVKPHPSDQLDLALDVVEHVLQGAYLLPIHARAKLP